MWDAARDHDSRVTKLPIKIRNEKGSDGASKHENGVTRQLRCGVSAALDELDIERRMAIRGPESSGTRFAVA